MRTEANRNGDAQARTGLQRGLLAGLAMIGLSSCGGGGSDDRGELCGPAPRIASTPPTVATAGRDYRYHVEAAYSCFIFIFFPVPAMCSAVDAVQVPAGASVFGATVDWTPTANQANSDVRFVIATSFDRCDDKATQTWTVRVYAPPVIQSFTAAKASVVPGESTMLTAVFEGSGQIDGLGLVTSGVPVATPPLSTGTSFTLVVTNGAGARVQQTISIGMLLTVTATNPANGATGVPVNRALTATFSKPMNGATITSSTFMLKDGSNNLVSGYVTYVGNVATFTPANPLAVLSQYTATITSGARDLDGNSMVGNYVWSFVTGAALDTTRPAVTSISPANGADQVDPERIGVLAVFSESIDPNSVNSSTFIVKDGNHNPVNGTVRVSNDGNSAEFMPTTSFASSVTFTAIVTIGIKDLAGNSMAADYSWTFSTATFGTWQATSTTSAPSARWSHTAVWTGSEMIVWGGYNDSSAFNSGARYNPVTDTWLPTSNIGEPSARSAHTAVWTGSEMIVWGGSNGPNQINTSARYNPATGTWTPISNIGAPSARFFHTAVWTGSEMIVWGGINSVSSLGVSNTGARYNPVTGVWAPISNIGAPSARFRHTAVWTGSEMIVWGGYNDSSAFNSGARYNPVTDTWLPTSNLGAPSASSAHTAVWIGSEMIVWGANNNFNSLGTRYNPTTDTWLPVSHSGAPSALHGHTTVWTGSKMIAWGGNSISDALGARYNPVTDTWIPISNIGAPSARYEHTAVWTGSEMIVWGGASNDAGNNRLNTGGRFRP
jgi:N-acetylneuraminic acid mutarotase